MTFAEFDLAMKQVNGPFTMWAIVRALAEQMTKEQQQAFFARTLELMRQRHAPTVDS